MFYLRLAYQNLRKSFSMFAPFLLSSLVLFTLITSVNILITMPSSKTLGSALLMGLIVMVIFSLIMEIYSYNFLLKQRTREFGLYNMLGMNKRQVVSIATLELLMSYVMVVGLGSLVSVGFSRFLYWLFTQLVQFNELKFEIIPSVFGISALIFAFHFLVLELIAIKTVGQSNPLVLFRSQEKGEKEPKGNRLLAALSLIGIGSGYYIAVMNSKPGLGIIPEFFKAVLLVIIGTYLFYISFMTWYLKGRRKDKKYFYTPQHFVTISQMIFRMKQHAVGLANISLLSVMAFVAIATTASLYSNTENIINQLSPTNSSFNFHVNSREAGEQALQKGIVEVLPHKKGEINTYLYTFYVGPFEVVDKVYRIQESRADWQNVKALYIITQDDYRKIGNDLPQLTSGQVAITKQDQDIEKIQIGDTAYDAMEIERPRVMPEYVEAYSRVLVVGDEQALETIQATLQSYQAGPVNEPYTYKAMVDLTDEEFQKVTVQENGVYKVKQSEGFGFREADLRKNYYGFSGVFLFMGILLGTCFLLGAALIIYYKQYSEGIEDRKTYHILQEVGMSKQMIKSTINSQTMMIFFLPLALAILHFVMALFMIVPLLSMLTVSNVGLIYSVSGGTVLLIGLLYFLIYKWTSRIYYRIIER